MIKYRSTSKIRQVKLSLVKNLRILPLRCQRTCTPEYTAVRRSEGNSKNYPLKEPLEQFEVRSKPYEYKFYIFST